MCVSLHGVSDEHQSKKSRQRLSARYRDLWRLQTRLHLFSACIFSQEASILEAANAEARKLEAANEVQSAKLRMLEN